MASLCRLRFIKDNNCSKIGEGNTGQYFWSETKQGKMMSKAVFLFSKNSENTDQLVSRPGSLHSWCQISCFWIKAEIKIITNSRRHFLLPLWAKNTRNTASSFFSVAPAVTNKTLPIIIESQFPRVSLSHRRTAVVWNKLSFFRSTQFRIFFSAALSVPASALTS